MGGRRQNKRTRTRRRKAKPKKGRKRQTRSRKGGRKKKSKGKKSEQKKRGGVDESPCVGLGGEDALHEGLGRHPLDWQHGAAPLPVVTGPADTETAALPQ